LRRGAPHLGFAFDPTVTRSLPRRAARADERATLDNVRASRAALSRRNERASEQANHEKRTEQAHAQSKQQQQQQ
jgi:hypothetical protein